MILDGFSSWEEYAASDTYKINCNKKFCCHGDDLRSCSAGDGTCELCNNCQCPHYKHPDSLSYLVIK